MDLIFIIVDNTYISLKKILNIMVPEKYPMVSDIKVFEDSDFNSNVSNFRIYLGVEYKDLETMMPSDVRDYVKDISKYVLKGNETLQIVFFDPKA
jgi:hypothetical protein